MLRRKKTKKASADDDHVRDEGPVVYTSIPGQKLTHNMAKMRYMIAETAQSNKAFDLQLLQRWVAADRKLGHWHYTRRAKKRRKRGIKKKKAVNYDERDSLRASARRKLEAKVRDRKAALKQRLAAREKLVSVVQDSVCRWTFYDRANKAEYRCVNPRSDHPLATEQSNYCHFHMTYCLNDHSATHGKMLRGLDIPNLHALCEVCFHQEHGGKPRLVGSPLHLPGVTRVNRVANVKLAVITNSAVPKPVDEMKRQGVGLDGEPVDAEKTKSVVISDDTDARPVCRFSRRHPKTGLRWRCSSRIIKHPVSRTMLTECGWHQTHCIGFHMGKAPFLEVPNELGLCPSHYSGRKGGQAPKNYGDNWWDVPVMKEPPPKVKLVPRRHKLAPGGLPPGFQFRSQRLRTSPRRRLPSDGDGGDDGKESMRARLLGAIRRTAAARKYAATRASVLFEWRKRKMGTAAATHIQRVYRNYRVKDKAARLRDHARFERRRNAAVRLQAYARFQQGALRAGQWLDERAVAAVVINRLGRGMLARRHVVRLTATRRLQRIGRGFLGRCRAGAQRTLQAMRDDAMDRAWAAGLLAHAVRGWYKRRHDPGPMRRDSSRDEPSALTIQRVIRGRWGRRAARQQRVYIDKYHFVVGWVQRHWRGYAVRTAFQDVFVPLREAIMLIQRAWRGSVGRHRANVERGVLEKGWQWLDPALPRDVLVRFMPRFGYGKGAPEIASKAPYSHPLQANRNRDTVAYLQACVDEGNAKRLRLENAAGAKALRKAKAAEYKTLTRAQQKARALRSIAAKRRWPRRPFAAFDVDNSGVISRREFRLALKSCGHFLSEVQTWTIMNRFDVAQNGLVDYRTFLEYVRAQDRPCTKHRIWGCADCVMYKGCMRDTCNCRRYRAPLGGNGMYMKALVCECGHYMTQHELLPKERLDKDYVPGEGYSRKQLEAMLTFEAPHFIPHGVDGSRLDEMTMSTAYTRIDLKASLNCVDDRVVTRIVPTPFEKDSKDDARAISMFQRLYADIIGAIIESSKSTVNGALGSLGWNDTTNPRVTNTGETVKDSWKFHPVGSAVAPPQLSKGAVQKKQERADKEAARKAAIVADPRSSSVKIRARLAEAKTEDALLMPLVAGNNTDLETYETKHTITRPLPLISHGKLRLTVDVTDIYIDVILTLIDPEAGVLEDDQQLTMYVYNLFTFFDRHWKHVVSDLRTGTLNPELPLNKTARDYVELHLTPAPRRARKFDSFLRTVGFHRRASGAKFKQDFLDEDEEEGGRGGRGEEEDEDDAAAMAQIEVMSDDGKAIIGTRIRPSSSSQGARHERTVGTRGEDIIGTPRSARGRPSTTAPGAGRGRLPDLSQHPPEGELTEGELDRPKSADAIRFSTIAGGKANMRAVTIHESFYNMAALPQVKPIGVCRETTRTAMPFSCDHPGRSRCCFWMLFLFLSAFLSMFSSLS